MKVNLKIGDVIGAEVIRIISGALVLELDNCQETVIPLSGLAGRDSKAKLDRFCGMSIGSQLTVEVTNAFTVACICAGSGTTAPACARAAAGIKAITASASSAGNRDER